MKSLVTIILSFFFLFSAREISMLNIKINDTESALDNITLEVLAKEPQMTKFRTQDGNDFSVTTANGKVVYMENDWKQDLNSRQPLFSDFTFGLTTLKDIRNRCATNGFTYKSRSAFTTNTDLIMFNCFEFESDNNEVLVTITKGSLKENLTETNLSSKLKLDALIIADKAYLDKIWGKAKSYDPNYHKITL